MKPKEFLDQLDDARVVAAIAAAESKTTGEIRVFVSGRKLGRDNITARAETRFRHLGMAKTRERNAVLIYIVPRDRKFAVIGDRGIHERSGPMFWETVAEKLTDGLRRGAATDAVLDAIRLIGHELARHFPGEGGGHNELPDSVERD